VGKDRSGAEVFDGGAWGCNNGSADEFEPFLLDKGTSVVDACGVRSVDSERAEERRGEGELKEYEFRNPGLFESANDDEDSNDREELDGKGTGKLDIEGDDEDDAARLGGSSVAPEEEEEEEEEEEDRIAADEVDKSVAREDVVSDGVDEESRVRGDAKEVDEEEGDDDFVVLAHTEAGMQLVSKY
jgi:hypothetical protein